MNAPRLYRGVWPQNVSKLAKYAIRFIDGDWKVSVLYEVGEGLRYLAVEGESNELIAQVNGVKIELQEQPGGTFYVNEYRHVIVPVKGDPTSGTGSYYYYAGQLKVDFSFEFEGEPLTTRPVLLDGTPLNPGEQWVGPRPGIPYVLAAGGGDIYYETPALTDSDPPAVRPLVTRQVRLSRVIGDRISVAQTVRLVTQIRGHQGGRFYVNEHGAIFTPVGAGNGNGLNYIYCGQINPSAWFPEPDIR